MKKILIMIIAVSLLAASAAMITGCANSLADLKDRVPLTKAVFKSKIQDVGATGSTAKTVAETSGIVNTAINAALTEFNMSYSGSISCSTALTAYTAIYETKFVLSGSITQNQVDALIVLLVKQFETAELTKDGTSYFTATDFVFDPTTGILKINATGSIQVKTATDPSPLS